MVKEVQDTPCEVVAIGDYDEHNATMGKYVRVKFDGEASSRRYTIAKTCAAAFKVGQKVKLTLESYLWAEGARDGSGKVFHVIKYRVVDAVSA